MNDKQLAMVQALKFGPNDYQCQLDEPDGSGYRFGMADFYANGDWFHCVVRSEDYHIAFIPTSTGVGRSSGRSTENWTNRFKSAADPAGPKTDRLVLVRESEYSLLCAMQSAPEEIVQTSLYVAVEIIQDAPATAIVHGSFLTRQAFEHFKSGWESTYEYGSLGLEYHVCPLPHA